MEKEENNMTDMISVKNLSHSYNEDGNFAVKNISFEVAKGEQQKKIWSIMQNYLMSLLAIQWSLFIWSDLMAKKM